MRQLEGIVRALPESAPDATHDLKCELAGELLRLSGSLRLSVTGRSMLPTVWPGDTVVVERVNNDDISEGDIVMFSTGRRFVAHRVVAKRCGPGRSSPQTRGDAVSRADSPIAQEKLVGKVACILRNGRRVEPGKSLRPAERAVAAVFQYSDLAARVAVGIHTWRSIG